MTVKVMITNHMITLFGEFKCLQTRERYNGEKTIHFSSSYADSNTIDP